MTPPDLQSLAADCEARAAKGEKPVLEWSPDGRPEEYSWQQSSPPNLNIIVRDTTDKRWMVYGVGARKTELSSELAAQLFAESLLRLATLALHPAPEPHVAAAVAFAAKVLAAMQEFGRTAGDADAWMCELGDMAMKSGFLCEPPEWNLTDAGRALLADAATIARPTEAPDAKPD